MFLKEIKKVLRISETTTAYDEEVMSLIVAAHRDLELSGVAPDKASDTDDPLIKRAITLYCKANFGWDNPDADRLQKSYDMLKAHLTLAGDYNAVP